MKTTVKYNVLAASLVTLSSCQSATLLAKLEVDMTVSKTCNTRPQCVDSIQSAINQANGQIFTIAIEPGHYEERVVINTNNITVIGDPAASTRLHHNLAAEDARQLHRDNWGTAGSATLTINAENIRIENLRIENSFDYLSNDALEKNDPKRIRHSQAVAVLLDEDSDKISFINSQLEGYQDTLFTHGKRAYFWGGSISGNVDFIFGDGQVLFENVDIISRPRGQTWNGKTPWSFITAPSTQIDQNYGLVFINCRLLREDGVPNNSVALGRPWHPTTTFDDGRYADPNAIGYAAFINTYMDAHIVETGWTTMNGTAKDGSKTAIFTPEDSRFYEQNNHGPGSAALNLLSARRSFETPVIIATVKAELLSGWQP